jgi:hypothetical protein
MPAAVSILLFFRAGFPEKTKNPEALKIKASGWSW